MTLPADIAGIRIPDSGLARAATEMVQEVSQDFVYHHVLRTYVFGAQVAAAQGWKFDEELFYLGALMHDLGLVPTATGSDRFEIVGADAADRFLIGQGVPADRRAVVWDAIALHTSVGIALRKRPEIALVHIGAGIDVLGVGLDQLPRHVIDRTLEILPRQDFKRAIAALLTDTVAANPKATQMTWMCDIGRHHVHGYHCPHFLDLVHSADFPE